MPAIPALYVHLPFCHSICPFCAFAVHGSRPHLHAPYLAALRQEIDLRAARYPDTGPVRALYFGGGTPSTLALADVAALLAHLRAAFPLAADTEIAFELNPEDVTADYVAGLLDVGVNRFSLGLQSLDDATLRALGRNHTAIQGRESLDTLHAMGAANVNVDLMFGAPGRPDAPFRRDVQTIAELGPAHVSLYGLDVEESTRFGRTAWIRNWAADQRDAQSETYLWAAARLRAAGYRHYEVSNFCRPYREGRQNLLVWDGHAYLGFGTGAHSYVDGVRWYNERHLRAYQRRLDAGAEPIAYRERLTPEQRANEALMLALRREEGLDVAAWEAAHGIAWGEGRRRTVQRLVREGRARQDGGRLVLTAEGFAVADAITEALMV